MTTVAEKLRIGPGARVRLVDPHREDGQAPRMLRKQSLQ